MSHVPALQFRRATLADVPALLTLLTSAYRGDASRAGWTTEADLLDGPRTDCDELEWLMGQPRSVFVLAERDGRLVACGHVTIQDGAGYFGMFAVDPAQQGGGIGSQILAEAEGVVRDEWHVATMRMNVIDLRATLLAYYERRGYVRTGIKKPFPYGQPRFGIPRRDDLRFEVLEKKLTP